MAFDVVLFSPPVPIDTIECFLLWEYFMIVAVIQVDQGS